MMLQNVGVMLKQNVMMLLVDILHLR